LVFEALYHDTTGGQNTATGRQALFSNTTGDSNTATGFSALNRNTTGAYNTANGFNANGQQSLSRVFHNQPSRFNEKLSAFLRLESATLVRRGPT